MSDALLDHLIGTLGTTPTLGVALIHAVTENSIIIVDLDLSSNNKDTLYIVSMIQSLALKMSYKPDVFIKFINSLMLSMECFNLCKTHPPPGS